MGLEKIQGSMIKHLKLKKNILKLRMLGIMQNTKHNMVVGRKAKLGVNPACWPYHLCTHLTLFEQEWSRFHWKSEMKRKQAIKQIIASTDENIVFWKKLHKFLDTQKKTAQNQVHVGYTEVAAKHVVVVTMNKTGTFQQEAQW